MNLDDLERLAKAATPGPWEVHENPRYWVNFPDQDCDGDPNRDANAAYVASLAPECILQMIACIEAADEMRDFIVDEESDNKLTLTYDRARAELEKMA